MTTEIRELPFFPTPYPDESFYSILCRYHARSASPSGLCTIKRLFGKHYVVSSTLHTAFRAEYMSKWVSPVSGLTPEHIVYEHSSYQYSLLGYIEKAATYPSTYLQKELTEYLSIPYRKLYVYGQRIGKRHGNICFCPACAEEEKHVYGEPYWHVLHQLEGVRFCPVHGTPIVETDISYAQRRHTFFPAFNVVDLSNVQTSSPVTSDISSIERKTFIRLASDIAWLLKNGLRLSKSHSIIQMLTGRESGYSLSSTIQVEKHNLPEELSILRKYMSIPVDKGFPLGLSAIAMSYPVVTAAMMGALYGSAKNFYKTVYCS